MIKNKMKKQRKEISPGKRTPYILLLSSLNLNKKLVHGCRADTTDRKDICLKSNGGYSVTNHSDFLSDIASLFERKWFYRCCPLSYIQYDILFGTETERGGCVLNFSAASSLEQECKFTSGHNTNNEGEIEKQ